MERIVFGRAAREFESERGRAPGRPQQVVVVLLFAVGHYPRPLAARSRVRLPFAFGSTLALMLRPPAGRPSAWSEKKFCSRAEQVNSPPGRSGSGPVCVCVCVFFFLARRLATVARTWQARATPERLGEAQRARASGQQVVERWLSAQAQAEAGGPLAQLASSRPVTGDQCPQSLAGPEENCCWPKQII